LIGEKYDGIKKRIQDDFRSNLLMALPTMDSRMKKDVQIENAFFEQCGNIIADFVIFFALSMFRVSAACTDGRVGTTINNRVVQMIFSQVPSDSILPLSRMQMMMVENIIVHAIALPKRHK
jgi:hypothetical protein